MSDRDYYVTEDGTKLYDSSYLVAEALREAGVQELPGTLLNDPSEKLYPGKSMNFVSPEGHEFSLPLHGWIEPRPSSRWEPPSLASRVGEALRPWALGPLAVLIVFGAFLLTLFLVAAIGVAVSGA